MVFNYLIFNLWHLHYFRKKYLRLQQNLNTWLILNLRNYIFNLWNHLSVHYYYYYLNFKFFLFIKILICFLTLLLELFPFRVLKKFYFQALFIKNIKFQPIHQYFLLFNLFYIIYLVFHLNHQLAVKYCLFL